MNMLLKLFFAASSFISNILLIHYFYSGLQSPVHPSGIISTAVVMLLSEFLILAIVLLRGEPAWFPLIGVLAFYGVLMLAVYSFYHDTHGLFLAFASFIFRTASLFINKYQPDLANKYIQSHVLIFMATIIPIAIGSRYITKALPELKASFPASALEVNTTIFNASEAVLLWAVFYFSIVAMWGLWSDIVPIIRQ